MSNLTFDGNVKVSWVTTVANVATPTAAELNAGTSLEAHLTPDGLETSFATASVDQSNLGSTFDSMAAGRRTPTLALTYKRFDNTGAATAAESTLVYRAVGFLAVRRNKLATGAFTAAEKVDVYTVQCGQPSPANPAPNETQKATVSVFSTADPSLQVAVT